MKTERIVITMERSDAERHLETIRYIADTATVAIYEGDYQEAINALHAGVALLDFFHAHAPRPVTADHTEPDGAS